MSELDWTVSQEVHRLVEVNTSLRIELAKARRLCGEALPYVAGKRFRWEMGSTILADDLARDLKEEAEKGNNG